MNEWQFHWKVPSAICWKSMSLFCLSRYISGTDSRGATIDSIIRQLFIWIPTMLLTLSFLNETNNRTRMTFQCQWANEANGLTGARPEPTARLDIQAPRRTKPPWCHRPHDPQPRRRTTMPVSAPWQGRPRGKENLKCVYTCVTRAHPHICTSERDQEDKVLNSLRRMRGRQKLNWIHVFTPWWRPAAPGCWTTKDLGCAKAEISLSCYISFFFF